jgi:GGDEF domain-containing protein
MNSPVELFRRGVLAPDVGARHEDEEFVLLLPTTDAYEPTSLAERLREALAS